MSLSQDTVFERLVIRDAEGDLVGDPKAIESLHEDLFLWRDTLIRLMQVVEKEFAERKGARTGTNREWSTWKAAQSEKKNQLLIKYREVKGLIALKNVDQRQEERQDLVSMVSLILDECKAIRAILEKKN